MNRFYYLRFDKHDVAEGILLDIKRDFQLLLSKVKPPFELDLFTTNDHEAHLKNFKEQRFFVIFSEGLKPMLAEFKSKYSAVDLPSPPSNTEFIMGTLNNPLWNR
ncbi:MAG: hypothetical protein AAB393_09810 [Bacteroidota bacterium]